MVPHSLLHSVQRYLTKLCDQMVALISKEHAEALVWDDASIDEESSEVADKFDDGDDRHFTFEVQKTKEEKESVTLHDGFKVFPVLPFVHFYTE